MEPGKCPILDSCPKVSMIKEKDFGTTEQYTAAIEEVCHKCDGPEKMSPPTAKIVKSYKLLAYVIKVGEEIDMAEGELPLGITLDSQGRMYAFILSPIVRIVPIVPGEKEKEPEGGENVHTSTPSPDGERSS